MPRKVFVAGEILTAADVNTNLMDQAVMVFDDATARATAIPTPVEGMVTYLKDTDLVEVFKGSAFAPLGGGFTSSIVITETDSSFSVPALGFPIVKVTVIGGGGGGGGATQTGSTGGAGGSTIFGTHETASGGAGGLGGGGGASQPGLSGGAGFVSQNGGNGGGAADSADGRRYEGQDGGGGLVKVKYVDLAGVSTISATIGAGGAGGAPQSASPPVFAGGAGGRGEVILEFVAG